MEAMHVPAISFVAMAMSAILSIGVPIALFFVVRKRYGKGFLPVFLGIAGFFVFTVILKQTLHWLVLDTGVIVPMERPFLYMLYAAFTVGVLDETARFVSFHLLKKRRTGLGVALKYGIGHGGMEAFIIGGAPMISSIALGILLNMVGAEGLAQVYGPDVLEIAATAPSLLFLSGVESMLALAIQISLSVIVFYAVYRSRKLWLYPLAILLRALAKCPEALFQVGVINNIWLVRGCTAALMAAIAVFAVLLHRRMEKQA